MHLLLFLLCLHYFHSLIITNLFHNYMYLMVPFIYWFCFDFLFSVFLFFTYVLYSYFDSSIYILVLVTFFCNGGFFLFFYDVPKYRILLDKIKGKKTKSKLLERKINRTQFSYKILTKCVSSKWILYITSLKFMTESFCSYIKT